MIDCVVVKLMENNTEPVDAAAEAWGVVAAIRNAADPRAVVPATTAQHAVRA